MIITCAQCQTRFRVDDGLIKETGTRVRCSNCQHVFTVFLPQARSSSGERSMDPIPRPPIRPAPRDQTGRGAERPGGEGDGAAQRAPQKAQSDSKRPALAAKPILPADRDFIIPGPQGEALGTLGDNPSLGLTTSSRPESGSLLGARVKYDSDGREASGPLEPDLGLGHDPVSDLRPASSKAAETISERPPVSPEDEPAAEKRGPNLFDPDRDPPEETVVARANPIRPRKKSSSKRPLLLLAGIIVLALLLIGGFFLFHFDSAIRSPGDSSGPSASGTGPAGSGDDLRSSSLPMSGGTSEASLVTEDVDSKNLLYFAPEQTNHHYRSNDKSGNILIIVGRMTNGYDSPRSFIKVKGVLKNSKGVVVAERESYAGNYLTEAELISLPMSEILTRLAIRSGQNSSNINVAPGSTIPFMLVFDKLPTDLAEFLVQPVSSSPSGGMAATSDATGDKALS